MVSTPEILTDWKFQWRGEMIYSHGSNHSRGVLVLINEQLQFELKNTVIDDNGRYILSEMTIQDSPFLLLNLYAPTKLNEQAAFFEEILSIIQTTSFDAECRIIMVGDFNVHLDAALDNSGGKIETKSTVKKILDIMLEYNLINIWRIHNPDKRQFTWRQKTPIIQRRIDFWLISDELQDDIKKQTSSQLSELTTQQSACPSIALKTSHLGHLIGNLIQAFLMTILTYSLLILNIQNGLLNSLKLMT